MLAPFAAMPLTRPPNVQGTNVPPYLYKVVTPYKPLAWGLALHECCLLYTFPNLVHDLTFGAPNGDLPPLTYTFIPNNLKSAEIDPSYMDNFLASEVATGHIDGPFTKDQAHAIFNGHFRTAPLGLIKNPGSDALWMICHHSKIDDQGHSTNSWIDSSINTTKYYLAADAADFVSISSYHLFIPVINP